MNGVVAACIALVLAGAALALRWGHLDVEPPWTDEVESDDGVAVAERVRRFVWHLDVLVIAAVVAGLLVIGPGGRLVMRLLAATAGDVAQGAVTEAGERVGRITVGGTIGFVVFVGLFGGFLLAGLWGGLRKWLPRRRAGALVVGLLFAVTFATRLDPLRPENRDFRIVGPGWLSVTSLLLLGALSVLTIAAVAGRVSRSLPMLDKRAGAVVAHLPLLFLVPFAGALPVIVLGAAAGIGLLGQASFRRRWSDRRVVLAGRLALAVVLVAFLPAFVTDLAAIIRAGG
jgi:hypothetical protein